MYQLNTYVTPTFTQVAMGHRMEEPHRTIKTETTVESNVVEDSDIFIQFIDDQLEHQTPKCDVANATIISVDIQSCSTVDANIAHAEGICERVETGSNTSSGIVSTSSLLISMMTLHNAKPSLTYHCKVNRKFGTAIVLLCVILLVIGVTQIPITLYYTDPPPVEGIESTLSLVDFQTCWVS